MVARCGGGPKGIGDPNGILRQTQPRVDCDGTTECLSARLAVDRNFVAVSKLDADVELLPVER
jgi:hypothetical protein